MSTPGPPPQHLPQAERTHILLKKKNERLEAEIESLREELKCHQDTIDGLEADAELQIQVHHAASNEARAAAARHDIASDKEDVEMQGAGNNDASLATQLTQAYSTIEFKDAVISQLQMALDDANRPDSASDAEEDGALDADMQLPKKTGTEHDNLTQALLIEMQNLIAVSENLTRSQTSRTLQLEDIAKKLAVALGQARGRARHWTSKVERTEGLNARDVAYLNKNVQLAESGVSVLSEISSGVLQQIQYDNGEVTKVAKACRYARKKFGTLLTRLGPVPQHAEARDFSDANDRFIKRENEGPISATARSVPREGAAVRGRSAGYASGRGKAAYNVTRQREPTSEAPHRDVQATKKHPLTDEQGFSVANRNKWASANLDPPRRIPSEKASSRNTFTTLPDYGQRLHESPAQPSPSSLSTSDDGSFHGARRPPKARKLQNALHSGKPPVHAPPLDAPATAQGQPAAAKPKLSTGTGGLRPPMSSFNPEVAPFSPSSFEPKASKSMAQVAAAPPPQEDPYSRFDALFAPLPAPVVVSKVSKNARMASSVVGNVVEPYKSPNLSEQLEKAYGKVPDTWADDVDGMDYEIGQDSNSSSEKDTPEEGGPPSRPFPIGAEDPPPRENVQRTEGPGKTGSNTAATEENPGGQGASAKAESGAATQVSQLGPEVLKVEEHRKRKRTDHQSRSPKAPVSGMKGAPRLSQQLTTQHHQPQPHGTPRDLPAREKGL